MKKRAEKRQRMRKDKKQIQKILNEKWEAWRRLQLLNDAMMRGA